MSMFNKLALPIPDEVVDQIAERVAEKVIMYELVQ